MANAPEKGSLKAKYSPRLSVSAVKKRLFQSSQQLGLTSAREKGRNLASWTGDILIKTYKILQNGSRH
jgi:hypothetical protein